MTRHARPTSRSWWRRPGHLLTAAVSAAVLATTGTVWATSPAPAATPTAAVAVRAPTSTSAPTTSATPTVAAVPADPRPTAVTDTAGRALVRVGGLDGVRAGLWRSDGGPSCRWSRDKGVSWTFDTAGRPKGPITIALRPPTSWFASEECGMWTWSAP